MARFTLYCFALLALTAADAQADNHFSVGVEGFRDRYDEPGADVGVDSHADYGSVTAGYQHDANGYFSAIDGRYSRGSEDYKSPSGTDSGVPQYEGEARFRTGMDLEMWHGMLMPYLGVGLREYYDKGKGTVTSLGDNGYDRHITQLYAPLGASYRFTEGNWIFTPMAEFDYLFWGRVSTHLGEVPGFYDVVNTQHSGYGLRGEFMTGQKYQYFGWEAGPFVRYWTVPDSNVATSPPTPEGSSWVEPHNTRLQMGAALRLTY